jgi:Ni/Co efflux regulator RcnB
MIRLKIFGAVIMVAAMIAAPIAAQADEYVRRHRHHHHHHYHHHRHIAWFSYLHNYGPGPLPGTYAYYDGPTSVRCKQSAAAYRGQDGRRHPCF